MQVIDTDFSPKVLQASGRNIFFLYGNERYTKELIRKRILRNFGIEQSDEFNYHVFDGQSAELANLSEELSSPPLFKEHKCVILSDYDPETVSADISKGVVSLLQDIDTDTVFVIITPDTLYKAKHYKFQGLLKKADEFGVCVDCTKKLPARAGAFVREYAKKRGVVVDTDAEQKLCELCLCDKAVIVKELDKLCAYHGYAENAKITLDDVTLLCPKMLEGMIFKLCDDIVANRVTQAFAKLDVLFCEGESAGAIISQISSNFVDIYRAKCLGQSRDFSPITSVYDYKGREFRLRNAAANCRELSRASLKNILNILCKYTSQSRSSGFYSEREYTEQMLCEIFRARS